MNNNFKRMNNYLKTVKFVKNNLIRKFINVVINCKYIKNVLLKII